MVKVYIIMENIGVSNQLKPRVVYHDKLRALFWIKGVCSIEAKDPSVFSIDEVEGVGF